MLIFNLVTICTGLRIENLIRILTKFLVILCILTLIPVHCENRGSCKCLNTECKYG